MKINIADKLRKGNESFTLSISAGIHVGAGRLRGVYSVMLGLIALCGLFGSVFTFLSACQSSGTDIIPMKLAAAVALAFFILFSAVFGLWEKLPLFSRILAGICFGGLLVFAVLKFPVLIKGFRCLADDFMKCAFERKSMYSPDFFYIGGEYVRREQCAAMAASCVIALIAAGACSFIKSQNILVFVCATFPLPELCLYFGLVPEHFFFALLAASWCAAAAADIARAGIFNDREAKRLFTKASAQSGIAAALIMLICFVGAELYVKAVDFKRPDSVKEFRNGVVIYMQDFSWDKLMNDVNDTLFPPKTGELTHDGKLGNTESVEFTGRNMLEVTLPSDCGGLYLKGFTGVHYTGSRWEKNDQLPKLRSDITSPEFLSGRILKHIDSFNDLRAMNVITRNVGVSHTVRYFPANSAGLLETDGVRRRYGVYFPKGDWRSIICEAAGNIPLEDELADDELKMREYAYKYCLDVPASFTAHEDFFKDFKGGSQADTLIFIRRELAKRCEYSLDSGRKPFGTDFAQWFLTANKKGSCTHFASAAVLLCRSMGIPARYCEGFVIKAEDIGDFPQSNGYTTVSVPDSRAHAWAEVYIDGFGWLSFESTPGYGNMMISPDSSDSGFEDLPASEITSVSTEAPLFSENPASSNEQSQTDTTETETAASGEESGTQTETAISSESTVTETAAVYEEPSVTGNGSSPVGTAVSYEQNVGEDYSETDIMTETQSSETSFSQEIAPKEDKPVDIWRIAVIIFIALAAALIPIVGRNAVFYSRGRRLLSAPHRAAGDMYRLLLKASGEENIPEELPSRLEAMHIPKELSETVVSAAMKARFGGGISVAEAKCSEAALEKALKIIYNSRSPLEKAFLWLTAGDRFLKGSRHDGKNT